MADVVIGKHFSAEASHPPLARSLAVAAQSHWVLAVALALFAWRFLAFSGFLIDDAAISFSYARTFADGHGWGFLYPGDYRVEGASNPLWVLVLAGLNSAGLSLETAAKGAGLVLGGGTVAMTHLLVRRLTTGVVARMSPLLLPFVVSFVLWSSGGLESALVTFLVASLVYLANVEDDSDRIRPWSVVPALLLVVSRPDAIIYGVAGIGFWAFRFLARRRMLAFKRFAAWATAFVAGAGKYFAWHINLWGTAFPNTVYTKAEATSGIFNHLWDSQSPRHVYITGFVSDGSAYWLLLAPVLLGLFFCRRGARFALADFLPCVTGAAADQLGLDATLTFLRRHRSLRCAVSGLWFPRADRRASSS